MYPPIFEICKADSGVTAVLGASPVRLYPFGEAPQRAAKPYAVWQTISGGPENYLGNLPDIDSYSLQVDSYAPTASSARAIAKAIRDAVELYAHVTFWGGESHDIETKNYRVNFTIDWWVPRP